MVTTATGETLCPLLSMKSLVINMNKWYMWPVLLQLLLWYINIAAEQRSSQGDSQGKTVPLTVCCEKQQMLATSTGEGQGQEASEAIQDKKEYNSRISFSINHHLFSDDGWRIRLEKQFTKGLVIRTNCPGNDRNVLAGYSPVNISE